MFYICLYFMDIYVFILYFLLMFYIIYVIYVIKSRKINKKSIMNLKRTINFFPMKFTSKHI